MRTLSLHELQVKNILVENHHLEPFKSLTPTLWAVRVCFQIQVKERSGHTQFAIRFDVIEELSRFCWPPFLDALKATPEFYYTSLTLVINNDIVLLKILF